MKLKALLIGVLIIFLSLVTVGCGKKKSQPPAQTDNQQTKGLVDLLLEQKKLKKFSSPEEIKNFFANRPAGSSGYLAEDSLARSSGLNLWGSPAQESKVAAPATGLGSGNNFSNTNVQVAGVDEDDIVKTDGNFIYALSNNVVSIIKAQPASDTKVVSSLKLDGYGQAIYLAGDRLVVFGDDQSMNVMDSKMFIRPSSYIYLSIYDIKDKERPNLLKTFKFEGGYTSSRLIDNKLYFISTTYNFYPGGDFILPKVFADGKLISSETSSNTYNYPEVYYIDTTSYYNATTVSLISINELEKPLTSQVYMMPAGQNIYASTNNLYLTYTKYLSDYQIRMSVARELLFDKLSPTEQKRIVQISEIDSSILSDDEKAIKINQVIDGFFARLAEAERTPLLKQLDEEFDKRYKDIYKELETTVIHKIGLDNGGLTYKGSGEVSGHVLNQFSMDEHNGYFRVATTRGQSWIMPFFASFRTMIMPPAQTQESYNNVYVLDDKLATVGSVENLASGERIYSVRFIGDKGYVVTFKQVDPLFALDLKEPTKPVVAGQLKIPGFSSYLHPYKENMLIGVGKEVLDNGQQGINVLGIKLSLFDVSDITKPQEVSSLKLGGRGSDTSVLFDHKAFLLMSDKDLLAIPMSLTKSDSNDYVPEFQGLGIFKIKDNKISEAARFYHPMKAENIPAGMINMEAIMRSLYINDNFYTMSPSMLGVHQLTNFKNIKIINLSNPISQEVPIGNPPVSTPYEKTR